MRNFKTKAICLLSSAVLLCGASAIPTNAATYNTNATSRPTVAVQTITGNYYLDKTYIEVESSKSAVINVYQSQNYTLPANSTVSYQWYKDGSTLSGETKSSLTVASMGTYYCKVTVTTKKIIRITSGRNGKSGSITSYDTTSYDTESATVNEKIAIKTQPKSGTINGSSYTITFEAKGGKTPYRIYTWFKDGEYVCNTQNPSLEVFEGGEYYGVVTDGNGRTATTNTIKVSYVPLKIASQPKGGTFDNDKGYFDMFVSVNGGTGSYKYKWYWNGKETSLTGNGMRVYNAGTGYCVITDANGKTVTTQNATVSYAPLKIVSQPTTLGHLGLDNGYYDMYVTVEGGRKPYKYKWIWNGKETSLTGNGMRVFNTGTGYCEITDATGNTIKSRGIEVTYPNVVIDDYTDYISFYSDFGTKQSEKIHIKVSGGSGSYTYFLQKKQGNNSWKDVAYSYTPEFELKYEDINDNYEEHPQKTYYMDNKWHYWGTSSNTNYYRIMVQSIGDGGRHHSCATTGEIKVYRSNGEAYNFTTDNFYY